MPDSRPSRAPPPRFARRLRRILLSPLVLLAALVFALEDWLWDPLTRLVARVMRWPVLRAIDRGVRRLPPHAALVVLLAPGLCLLPVKFLGLALIAHGHAVMGMAVFVLAKVLGTAMLTWLWGAVQTAVRRIRWADRGIDALLRFKALVYDRVLSHPVVVVVRRRVRRLGERGRARWNAWRAARRMARRARR